MKEFHSEILQEQFGSDDTTKLRLIVKRSNGKAHLELSKTVSQNFETKDFEKAEALFDRLTGGNGVRIFRPEDMLL